MAGFTLRRLALFLPVLLGTTFLVFAYVHAIPGDPVAMMLGEQANPQLVADLRARYGLDDPWLTRYFDWLQSLAVGDLGATIRTRYDIQALLLLRAPATIQLAIGGFIVGMGIAVPLGLLGGSRPGSRLDVGANTFALAGLAVPTFISGTILLIIFGVHWRVLPTSGYVPFWNDPIESIRHMILPSLTLGMGIAPYFLRVVRTEVAEVMQEPHLPYGSSKGIRSLVLRWRYIVRNTLPRVVVLVALLVGGLLGGSVFVEEVFSLPGMGRLLVSSVIEREFFVIQAIVLIYAVIFAVVNLGAELLQGILDPRTREYA